ncbi:MoxR family ATPase [Candidatus Dependentiae bacterium]|nr:MoxR family ATPase [Candidatus Dependentiae bacterium]
MQTEQNRQTIIDQVKAESIRFHRLNEEVSKVIVGNHDIIDFIVIAILCNGHILLEGIPGVAKTTMIKSVTRALGLRFNRIQFTPDLLPADVIGTLIYNPKTQEFETKKGPIFANLILADEINRSPAKVQSALLEAMQEHQVTIGSNSYKLDEPFLVFATQNPIEQEGTYQLPEAQLDRFMFKLHIKYPDKTAEKEILHRSLDVNQIINVLSKQDIFEMQELVKQVYVDEKIVDYIVNIIFATREPQKYGLNDITSFIQYGASPRATLAIHKTAKAYAFIKKRHFVIPDDVKAVAPAILRHRILLTYEAEAQEVTSDQIISTILNTIPTP